MLHLSLAVRVTRRLSVHHDTGINTLFLVWAHPPPSLYFLPPSFPLTVSSHSLLDPKSLPPTVPSSFSIFICLFLLLSWRMRSQGQGRSHRRIDLVGGVKLRHKWYCIGWNRCIYVWPILILHWTTNVTNPLLQDKDTKQLVMLALSWFYDVKRFQILAHASGKIWILSYRHKVLNISDFCQ